MLWRPVLIGLVLVILTAGTVAADHTTVHDVTGPPPSDDPTSNPLSSEPDVILPETPATPADSLLAKILGGAGELASGIGSGLKNGVTGAAGAIGDAFMFVLLAAWDGTTVVVGATVDAVAWSVTGVYGIMAAAVSGAVSLVTFTAAILWGGLESLFVGAARMRPAAVSEPVWAGSVATAVTAASLASQFGLASWMKKLGFAGLGGLGLFSRIAKDDILEHPLRSEIFEAIKANPGIHISALARTVDAGWGTTIHHLRKLQEKELVAVRFVNNQKCYFHNGGSVSRSAWGQIPELKNPTANGIAQFILHHPFTPVTDISTALGLTPSLVSHHVAKLERAGVVEKVRDGRFVKLAVTEAARHNVFGETVPTDVTAPVAGVAA